MSKRITIITLSFLVAGILFYVSTSNATNTDSHIHKGGYSTSDAQNLSVQIQSSVGNFGYTWRVQNSLNQMTGLSSNLGWHQTTAHGANITVRAGNYTLEPWYGQAAYFCSTAGVLYACSSDANPRAQTQIQINEHTLDRDRFNYDERWFNILHEVGHALSLGHVYANEGTGHSVMRSGKHSYTSPQPMDQWHINYKWGN